MNELERRAEIASREVRMAMVADAIQMREADDGSTTLVGYASVTESPYTMQDWLGEYEENVRAGAFQKTLQESADVRLLVNHEGIPLARTKSGTMSLREIMVGADDPLGRNLTGLWVEAPNLDSNSMLVNTVRSAMKRGDLDEMSFAFQVIRQMWSPDYMQRDILEVRLYDVSVVTFPANPATSATIRARDLDSLTEAEAREAYERLQRRFAPQAPAGLRWYEVD